MILALESENFVWVAAESEKRRGAGRTVEPLWWKLRFASESALHSPSMARCGKVLLNVNLVISPMQLCLQHTLASANLHERSQGLRCSLPQWQVYSQNKYLVAGSTSKSSRDHNTYHV